MYVTDMRKKTTQDLEVFYSLVLKIPFNLRSTNFLELFSKFVFSKDQGCCREHLITLACFLYFTSNFWWTTNITFALSNVRILLYFNHEKIFLTFLLWNIKQVKNPYKHFIVKTCDNAPTILQFRLSILSHFGNGELQRVTEKRIFHRHLLRTDWT